MRRSKDLEEMLKTGLRNPNRSDRPAGVKLMKLLNNTKGVYIISSDPSFPRPYVGIVGSVHGNEPCGLRVIEGLLTSNHPLRKRLRRGTLILIHGNPEATASGKRHTVGGMDLNRLFGLKLLDASQADKGTYEHRRAMSLAPILDSLDAVLDLHSSTSQPEPFAIVPSSLLPLASRLQCSYVTYGWYRTGMLGHRTLTSRVLRNGKPAVAVECGQHESSAAVTNAWRIAENFLSLLGLLDGTPPAMPVSVNAVEMIRRVG